MTKTKLPHESSMMTLQSRCADFFFDYNQENCENLSRQVVQHEEPMSEVSLVFVRRNQWMCIVVSPQRMSQCHIEFLCRQKLKHVRQRTTAPVYLFGGLGIMHGSRTGHTSCILLLRKTFVINAVVSMMAHGSIVIVDHNNV